MLGRSGTGASGMSIIPLHLQRRFDERWAARFGSLIIPAVTKNVGLKGSPVNMRRARKKQQKPAGLRLKAKAEMSENEKSTDPELSAAERKELRGREAKEA